MVPFPIYFYVYWHSDLKGPCSNVTETRHVKIVGACRLWWAMRSALGHIILKIHRKEWFLVQFKNGYRCKPMLNSLTGCHERLIWTPLRICGVRWRGQCRTPGPAHFLNVLLAERQSRRRINYELVMQAETRPKLVPTVLHPAAPPHHPQATFCSRGTLGWG